MACETRVGTGDRGYARAILWEILTTRWRQAAHTGTSSPTQNDTSNRTPYARPFDSPPFSVPPVTWPSYLTPNELLKQFRLKAKASNPAYETVNGVASQMSISRPPHEPTMCLLLLATPAQADARTPTNGSGCEGRHKAGAADGGKQRAGIPGESQCPLTFTVGRDKIYAIDN
jgi:hypothetical protein